MKWPIVSNTVRGSIRTTTVEYLQKTTSLRFNFENCKFCNQCVKACPKGALSSGVFDRNSPTMKLDRLPQLKDPLTCVYCGTCMIVCPFDAVHLAINEEILSKENLPLVQKKILPTFTELKIGKFVLSDDQFQSKYWDRIASKIVRVPTKKSTSA